MTVRRQILWTFPLAPDALEVIDGSIVIVNEHSVIGLDDDGVERWRQEYVRKPYHLVACGRGVAADLPDRAAPTEIVGIGLDGAERWRYQRRWTLLFGGLAGDARGLIAYGQDFATTKNQWVALEPDGAVTLDITPPVESAPRPAGPWLVASIGDGEKGVLRTDRAGAGARTITTLAHDVMQPTDDSVLLNTTSSASPELVAIDLATGRERWRASGGNNLEIATDASRAAWVGADRRPVVHEVASGRRLWVGDPLPAIGSSDGYACKLGPDALVCYCGHRHVVYHALGGVAPLETRAWDRDDPSASRFADRRFLESSFHGLICWELA
ncbi:MAG TPA: hypothetical protein VLT45_00600 [Kofleriaceae bacterium]|nr:hypothetical protein [Kofleriaceae bacterium]